MPVGSICPTFLPLIWFNYVDDVLSGIQSVCLLVLVLVTSAFVRMENLLDGSLLLMLMLALLISLSARMGSLNHGNAYLWQSVLTEAKGQQPSMVGLECACFQPPF